VNDAAWIAGASGAIEPYISDNSQGNVGLQGMVQLGHTSHELPAVLRGGLRSSGRCDRIHALRTNHWISIGVESGPQGPVLFCPERGYIRPRHSRRHHPAGGEGQRIVSGCSRSGDAVTSATLYYWVYAENLMGLPGPISEMLTAANKGLVVSSRVEVFLESGTWTWIDEGSVLVFLVGGGGGGGGGGEARGGGGGAGGDVVERIIATNSGDNVTVTVGAGGAGGAGDTPTGVTGGTGGISYFGALRARGGTGGTGGAGGGGGSDPGGEGGAAYSGTSPFGVNVGGGVGGTDGGSSGSGGNTVAGIAAGGSGGTGSSVANQGAGGGGGGSNGVGADGGDSATDNAVAGAVNTGAGGGGGSAKGSGDGYGGKAGGSGMCIVISQGTD